MDAGVKELYGEATHMDKGFFSLGNQSPNLSNLFMSWFVLVDLFIFSVSI